MKLWVIQNNFTLHLKRLVLREKSAVFYILWTGWLVRFMHCPTCVLVSMCNTSFTLLCGMLWHTRLNWTGLSWLVGGHLQTKSICWHWHQPWDGSGSAPFGNPNMPPTAPPPETGSSVGGVVNRNSWKPSTIYVPLTYTYHPMQCPKNVETLISNNWLITFYKGQVSSTISFLVL